MNKPFHFKIEIPKEVHNKIMYWVQKADFEISGFGTVIYNEERKTFVVQDALLIKQEGSAAMTDIDATALGKAMYEVHRRQMAGELKWWWHSHVNMSVFWSGTDIDTINDLGKNGWIVASVFNKKEEVRSAFCAKISVPAVGDDLYFADDIATEIPDFYDSAITQHWDSEYDATVSYRKFGNYKNYHPNYASYLADAKTECKTTSMAELAPKFGKYDTGYEPELKEEQEWKREAHMIGMAYEKYKNIMLYGSPEELLAVDRRLQKVLNKDAKREANGNKINQ